MIRDSGGRTARAAGWATNGLAAKRRKRRRKKSATASFFVFSAFSRLSICFLSRSLLSTDDRGQRTEGGGRMTVLGPRSSVLGPPSSALRPLTNKGAMGEMISSLRELRVYKMAFELQQELFFTSAVRCVHAKVSPDRPDAGYHDGPSRKVLPQA